MKREEIQLIQDMISVDWIEDKVMCFETEEIYSLMSNLIKDNIEMKDKIDYYESMCANYNKVMKDLNRENKKMYKLLKSKS